MNITHAFKEDDEFYEEIAKNIWLMDNHRWAYYIWEFNRRLFEEHKVPIIHIDYHWDSGDDFYNHPKEEENFKNLSLNAIKELVHANKWIRFDSFICPALIRGISNEVHFLCFQGDEDDQEDSGIYADSLERLEATQYIYRTSTELKNSNIQPPYIFDFCIDAFNRSTNLYEGEIWTDNEINNLLSDIKNLVVGAELITISMSYGYSGTAEDTKRLTQYITEQFCNWRNETSAGFATMTF